MNYKEEFKKKFGKTIEEWREETIKKTKEMKIKNIEQKIEDIEYMDNSPTKTRMMKIWKTKRKNADN